jgi:hypothetical protein
LSLPEKWREASVLNQDGIMDPNLTLAHIMQNTAVIQLHQCVAFPPAALRACRVALPSTSSAETCISAAYEIGTIAQQFLQQSSGITHPQLGFCLFIAGRVLLAHATHHGTKLHCVFATISAALQEISARWDHRRDQHSTSLSSSNNLASRLHSRLLSAEAAMISSVTHQTNRIPLDVGRPVYSEDRDRSRATSVNPTTCAEHCTHDRPALIYHASAVDAFEAPADANQPTVAPLPLVWDDQANLLANYDTDTDLFSMPQVSGGGETEGADADFTWMSGLEGVFDEQFEQVSLNNKSFLIIRLTIVTDAPGQQLC